MMELYAQPNRFYVAMLMTRSERAVDGTEALVLLCWLLWITRTRRKSAAYNHAPSSIVDKRYPYKPTRSITAGISTVCTVSPSPPSFVALLLLQAFVPRPR